MSKVVAIMSMSLDGYVADLNDGVAEVFDWYFTSGDVEIHTGASDPMTFKVSGQSAEHLRGLTSGLGAVLTGRRTFDVAQGWGGNHAWGTLRPPRRHASRPWQPDGDPGRRRYTPALPGTQGVVGPHTFSRPAVSFSSVRRSHARAPTTSSTSSAPPNLDIAADEALAALGTSQLNTDR